VADLASALEAFGHPDAHDQAGRVRTILNTRSRLPVPTESSGPISRVAITGGTSVSWGDTQLAPLRKGRTRAITAGIVGVSALVVLIGVGVWRAHESLSVTPAPSANAAVGGATASAPFPSSIAPAAPVPDPPPIAAQAPTSTTAAGAPGSVVHGGAVGRGPAVKPPSSASTTAPPATTHPPATVTPTAKPTSDLPTERE
jgi:hypothetical protein